MFAFAIWDSRRAFAVRSRVTAWASSRSSTTRAHGHRVRVAPACAPRAASGACLVRSTRKRCGSTSRPATCPAPLSVFAGVQKLPPAHHAAVGAGALALERYWDYAGIAPEPAWERRRRRGRARRARGDRARSVRWRLLVATCRSEPSSPAASTARSWWARSPRVAPGRSRPSRSASRSARSTRVRARRAVAGASARSTTQRCCGVDGLLELVSALRRGVRRALLRFLGVPDARGLAHGAAARDGVRSRATAATSLRRLPLLPDRRPPLAAAACAAAPRASRGPLSRFPAHRLRLLAGALGERSDAGAFAFLRSVAKDFASGRSPPSCSGASESLETWFAREAARFPAGLTAAERACGSTRASRCPTTTW